MSSNEVGARSYGGKRRHGLAWLPWLALLLLLLLGLLIALLLLNVNDNGDKPGIDLKNDPVATTTAMPSTVKTTATTTVTSTPGVASSFAAGSVLVGGGGAAVSQSQDTSSLIQGTVLFPEASAALDASATRVIAAAAQNIKADSAKAVLVTGYTDVVGGDPSNNDLSQQRADAVAKQLQSALGSSVTIGTSSKGEADPVAANSNQDGSDNPSGRQQNRRAVIAEVEQ